MATFTVTKPNIAFCMKYDAQDFDKGTTVSPPENWFGVVYQDGKFLTAFDKRIELNKKDVPGLNVPLFGKIKKVELRFMPLGIRGKFIGVERQFKLKSGRMAKITYNTEYEMGLQNVEKITWLDSFISRWSAEKDNVLCDIVKLNDSVFNSLYKLVYEREAKGDTWKCIKKGEDSTIGLTRDESNIKILIRMQLQKDFEKFGYNIKLGQQNLIEIDYAD